MSRQKKLIRSRVGEIPLMEALVRKLGLREILEEFLPGQNTEEVESSDLLIMLIYNLAIGKAPLYELEDWVNSLELRCMGYGKSTKLRLTDDRFGKALDRLYSVDRASLMTRIVVETIRKFDVDLGQLHNDSTTVKAFGKYPGRTDTGFELRKGNSKDHRPDLKQLVYSLSISSDGAVPYSGRPKLDTKLGQNKLRFYLHENGMEVRHDQRTQEAFGRV
jgi:transposase